MTDAWEVIASAEALLLDFDGPITPLMPPPLNARAADRARKELNTTSLPDEILTTTDHLAVLRFAADRYPERFESVERACSDAEIDCARISSPSPEAEPLFAAARLAHVPVAVVSNNSDKAVREFLRRFGWESSVQALACRTPEVGPRLKPDPLLVQKALEAVRIDPGKCVFVGDSLSDVQAGHACGVPVIGLAKTPARGSQLLEAGAIALIDRTA